MAPFSHYQIFRKIAVPMTYIFVSLNNMSWSAFTIRSCRSASFLVGFFLFLYYLCKMDVL